MICFCGAQLLNATPQSAVLSCLILAQYPVLLCSCIRCSVNEVLAMAEDLIVDIPKLLDYLAPVVGTPLYSAVRLFWRSFAPFADFLLSAGPCLTAVLSFCCFAHRLILSSSLSW